jgi:hypothetical protein
MVNYKTSRDYKRLKELLDAGNEVVCFTTYDFNWAGRNFPGYKPLMTTDICRAKFIKGSVPEQDRYIIGVRGCVFVEYWKNLYNWTFEEACESAQIEFIEPSAPINSVLKK